MLLKLFLGFFKIGIISYGGGPAAVPIIKTEYVDRHKMISEEEFIEIIAICNMLPGPLITKISAVIGYKIKGILGAFFSLLGTILPSAFFLILIIKYFYLYITTNKNIAMMIASVTPVIAIMMLLIVISFVSNTRKKFKNINLIAILAFLEILILVIKINVIFIILSIIFLSFLIPKKKEDDK